jgi:methyl-accepting chemotaxis protein
MKITTQLKGVGIGLVIFTVANTAAIFLSETKSDSTVINQAGLVRGGTQRLVKMELTEQPNDKLIAALSKKVSGLIKGNAELGLPPATDADFLAKMQQVELAWENLQDSIVQTRRDPTARPELFKLSEDYFKLTDAAVLAAEHASQAKAVRLRVIEVFVVLVNVLILIVLWRISRRMTQELQSSVGVVASSSAQIAASVEEQERTISQQSSAVNQTTATMEELGASSLQSAHQAEASAEGAQQALSLVQSASKAMQQAKSEMGSLKEKVTAIAEQIMQLGEQTGQIAGISELVSDISTQTNMLALKAAVEAVRVGEQGKGFGVVAAEIRKLSDQTKKSAERINALVSEIQASMNSAVMVTDEGTKTAIGGMHLVQNTANAFSGVTDAINSVFVNNQQILLSAKQQAVAVQQVVAAMNSINVGAQETASVISQVKSSTGLLSETAGNLKVLV